MGYVAKHAKKDLKAARAGRIEEMGSLRPVLSAINANKAADYTTMQREAGKNFAFSQDPSLQQAMLQEGMGRLDQNAGLQFANAAAGAYQNAADQLESARRFRGQMGLQSAEDQAKLYLGSMYDGRRKGGLLQQMMSAGIGLGQAAGEHAIYGV